MKRQDCLDCINTKCIQAGKDVLPRKDCMIQNTDDCPNCDGCRKLDFYYCANCGKRLRRTPIGG